MNIDFDFATATEICQTLGVRLRAHRLAQNLQQSELAEKAGVSKLTVINLEKKGTVTFLSLIQIVSALGLIDELADLFKLQTLSIAMMEAAEATSKRVRASTRKKG
jgi:transcriptional regulator with XRE-family HTH domain